MTKKKKPSYAEIESTAAAAIDEVLTLRKKVAEMENDKNIIPSIFVADLAMTLEDEAAEALKVGRDGYVERVRDVQVAIAHAKADIAMRLWALKKD